MLIFLLCFSIFVKKENFEMMNIPSSAQGLLEHCLEQHAIRAFLCNYVYILKFEFSFLLLTQRPQGSFLWRFLSTCYSYDGIIFTLLRVRKNAIEVSRKKGSSSQYIWLANHLRPHSPRMSDLSNFISSGCQIVSYLATW